MQSEFNVQIMGILNVTPDSFSDGGKHRSVSSAVDFALKMVDDGADIIDVGGESTRPGSTSVDEDEEFGRVVPVVEALKSSGVKAKLSVDTRRLSVARRCLELGVDIINDVSAFESNPGMADIVRDFGASCVLMHGYGGMAPRQGVFSVKAVVDYLRGRVAFASGRGIPKDKILVDPGIGFNKTTNDNLAILRSLDMFADIGVPLLMAASRKRFIGEITGVADPASRLDGSLAVAVWSAMHGATVLRVHDVAQTRRAIEVVEAIME